MRFSNFVPKVDYRKLRYRMSMQEINNKQLGQIIGYTGAAVGKWLRSKEPMPILAIIRVALLFDMTTDEIVEELLGIDIKHNEYESETIAHLVKRVKELEIRE